MQACTPKGKGLHGAAPGERGFRTGCGAKVLAYLQRRGKPATIKEIARALQRDHAEVRNTVAYQRRRGRLDRVSVDQYDLARARGG